MRGRSPTVTVTSLFAAPQGDLESLALRAAQGDREAEARVMEQVTPHISAIVHTLVAKRVHLARHKADLLGDGVLVALQAVRRFDGRTRLINYVVTSVYRKLLSHANAYGSRIGAHVGRRKLDFESPAFSPVVSIGNGDAAEGEGGDISEGVLEAEAREHREREVFEARRRLWQRMKKRLTPIEREVIERRFGLTPPQRSGRRKETRTPETQKSVGVHLGISLFFLKRIETEAMAKLGMETLM